MEKWYVESEYLERVNKECVNTCRRSILLPLCIPVHPLHFLTHPLIHFQLMLVYQESS